MMLMRLPISLVHPVSLLTRGVRRGENVFADFHWVSANPTSLIEWSEGPWILMPATWFGCVILDESGRFCGLFPYLQGG